MKDDNMDSPPPGRPRLSRARARACARLESVLLQAPDPGEMTDAERERFSRIVYGHDPDAEPVPAPAAPSPNAPPPRRLRPAYARSVARLVEALAQSSNVIWTAKERQNAIREIYGLPPED